MAALVAIAIFSVLTALVYELFASQGRSAQSINIAISATVVRSNLLQMLENGLAWQATENDTTCNTSFTCLNVAGGCPAQYETTPQPINCFYSTQGKVFDASNAAAGFSERGIPCSTFNDTNPDPACPFRPVITFTCESMPCTGATPLLVDIALTYRGIRGMNLNMSRFSILDVAK